MANKLKTLKSILESTCVASLVFLDNVIICGASEISFDNPLKQAAFLEEEMYRLQGGESQKREECRKRANSLKPPYFSAFVQEGDLFLPVYAEGFDYRLLSLMKASSETNTSVNLSGFYSGGVGNCSCSPLFLQNIEMKNIHLKRDRG